MRYLVCYNLLSLNVSSWAHLLVDTLFIDVYNNKQTHLQCPARMNSPELKLGHWI